MTSEPVAPARAATPRIETTGDAAAVAACCSAVYGSPLAELLVGPSLHPGGLESTRMLLAAARLPCGARLLDAGCGLGTSARLAAAEFGLRVEAVDASAAIVARAVARDTAGEVVWSRADLLALPAADGTFDGVLSECVLSTTARGHALAELRRVLRDGGTLALSDVVTSGAAPLAIADRLLGAALCIGDAWLPGEIEDQLAEAGFTIERRWDRSETVVDLVDRIESRVRLALAVARGSSLDLAGLAELAGLGSLASGGPDAARHLADDVRAAVRRGEIGYVAVIARAR